MEISDLGRIARAATHTDRVSEPAGLRTMPATLGVAKDGAPILTESTEVIRSFSPSKKLCGIAGYHCSGGDIFGDDASGTDDGAFTNDNSTKNSDT